MVTFESDYTTGCLPEVLEALARTNLEPASGYGADPYTKRAAEKIRRAAEAPEADVVFLAGGTQTNAIVIDALLKDWEGAVAAATGHIHAHEAGAVELAGRKILALPAGETEETKGKLAAADVARLCELFYADANHEHMVFPGLVYISHPTEYGTLYTKAELEELRAVCDRFGMRLFLDGARLAYGLASYGTDVTLPDIARLTDVFYFGGTKAGLLLGEAVVFRKGAMPPHFVNFIKKRGALLAKGRATGVPFDALFTDGLWERAGRRAIDAAEELKAILREKGIPFFLETPTNQQFAILENARMAELAKKVGFGFWETYDETRTVVRFATSWSTTEEDLAVLRAAL